VPDGLVGAAGPADALEGATADESTELVGRDVADDAPAGCSDSGDGSVEGVAGFGVGMLMRLGLVESVAWELGVLDRVPVPVAGGLPSRLEELSPGELRPMSAIALPRPFTSEGPGFEMGVSMLVER